MGFKWFYRVGTDEQGVVTRFGEYVRTTEPGLPSSPFPIEKPVNLKLQKLIELKLVLGLYTIQSKPTNPSSSWGSAYATGDENIVISILQFLRIINDAKIFYLMRNPEITIKYWGKRNEKNWSTPIDPMHAEGKSIVEDVKNRTQSVLDYYKSGILITQVQLQADPPN